MVGIVSIYKKKKWKPSFSHVLHLLQACNLFVQACLGCSTHTYNTHDTVKPSPNHWNNFTSLFYPMDEWQFMCAHNRRRWSNARDSIFHFFFLSIRFGVFLKIYYRRKKEKWQRTEDNHFFPKFLCW